jgi:uncharacterized protein (UPF0548 family)
VDIASLSGGVAARILRGVDRHDRYIFTHAQMRPRAEQRWQRILAGFAAADSVDAPATT